MSNQYVGITGFTDEDQVYQVTNLLLPDMLLQKLMVGVLVSHKTLHGETNKWPNRYPKMDKIGQIFVKHPQVLNIVHYHTSEQTDLFAQLELVMKYAGDSCDGIQLNIVWPDPKEIQKFKKIFPEKKIVLQLSRTILNQPPDHVARRLVIDYEGLIDYVLLDASGGQGLDLDANFLLPYVEKIKLMPQPVDIVVAGGLWSNNLYLLDPLLSVYPDLSIDAEGNLRDFNDNLWMIRVKNYLIESMTLFDRHNIS